MRCFVNDIASIIKTPADDREYAQMTRMNIRWLYLLLICGACALVVSVANEFWHFTKADSFIDGVYYWYGENKEKSTGDNNIWHWGIRCYTSTDL